MMLGRVDEVDGDFIATRFIAGLVPAGCMYITHKSTQKHATWSPLRIRTDWRSVGFAYARVWLPVVVVIFVGTEILRRKLDVVSCVVAAALVAISIVAHRSGRLPDIEKARLRLLGTVTGLRIDPFKLQRDTRDRKRESLGELMVKGGIPLSSDEILSLLDDIPVPALPLVYGYARYAGDDLAWRDCAEMVYARHEQSEL